MPVQALSLIAWFRRTARPGEEPDAWVWDEAVRPEPVSTDGARAALERMKARILRRSGRHLGEYCVTPDDVTFPPADETSWPVVTLAPRPKAPPKPLTEAQKKKRNATLNRKKAAAKAMKQTAP
jgi:hypothetical protein